MIPSEVLAAPNGSGPVRCARDDDLVTIFIAMTALAVPCPDCGHDAHRIHSRYVRPLADLPCFGTPVRLELTIRRFRCSTTDCPRRIFAERLPGFAAPYARATDRLRRSQEAIGHALGGAAGARLTVRLAMGACGETLLRRVKQRSDAPPPAPRYVGIDDWAWCKGKRYGTIVVDLERGEIIDLLSDRETATVTEWFKVRPSVELVSRDRAAGYAQAATEGASQSRQVADRWHLLKNLREAVEHLFERHHKAVAETLRTVEASSEPPSPSTSAVTDEAKPIPEKAVQALASSRCELQRVKHEGRAERFVQVHERRRKYHSIRRIAQELRMTRRTVERYLRYEQYPTRSSGRPQPSQVDRHRDWIDARLAEGVTNIRALRRQLKEQGLACSYGSVWRYVSRRIGVGVQRRAGLDAKKPFVPPTAKQLSFSWVRRVENRKPEEQSRIDIIRGANTELAAALELADEFAALIRKQSQGTLSDWLIRGEASTSAELRRFAQGVRRDEAAISAAITERWSNGPTEGHVNRLKALKRQMFGRAGFVLLKARVLPAA